MAVDFTDVWEIRGTPPQCLVVMVSVCTKTRYCLRDKRLGRPIGVQRIVMLVK